jgi:small GTP-binding protein
MGSSPRDGRCLKVITLGQTHVGKSCLILKATNKDFICPVHHPPTIGVDFKILHLVDQSKSPVRMHIWDTAGQERFHQINRMYYREVSAAVFVFDLTQRSSLEDLDEFWRDFQDFGPKSVFSILVGNKNDLKSAREVTEAEALAWAEAHSVPYMETSAMTGDNVGALFLRILQELSSRPRFSPSNRSFLSASPTSPSKKKRFFHC